LSCSCLNAQDERHEAETALADAETALRDLQRSEPGRLAYAYTNNEALNLGVDIGTAEAGVNYAHETAEHIREIENALATEIRESEHRLKNLRHPVRGELAAVVTGSESSKALFAARDEAWQRLRTLCVLFTEISRALEGNIPEHLRTKFLAEEPLEKGMSRLDGEKLVRFQWDEKLVSDWLQALGALQHDADVPLPWPARPPCLCAARDRPRACCSTMPGYSLRPGRGVRSGGRPLADGCYVGSDDFLRARRALARIGRASVRLLSVIE
jgi:hypothetical protein